MTTVIAIEKNTSLYCLFEFFWRRYRHRVLLECSISYEYYVRAVRLDFCLPPIWSRRNCICCYFMCGFFFQFFFFSFSFSSIRFEWYFFGWNEPPNCQRKIKYEIEMKNEEMNKKGQIKGKLCREKKLLRIVVKHNSRN